MSIEEDLNKIEKKVEKQSFAMEMLQFAKDQNKQLEKNNARMFWIIIILICCLGVSVGYTIYLLNDIGTIDTSITQDNSDGDNNYIGNDGDITYGETND